MAKCFLCPFGSDSGADIYNRVGTELYSRETLIQERLFGTKHVKLNGK